MQDKETKKTLIFVLVAGMALLVAWEPWRPAPADTSVPERVGQKLFPEFTNPLAAKSLEVVTFDEEIGRDARLSRSRSRTACGRFPRTATIRLTPRSIWPRPPRR